MFDPVIRSNSISRCVCLCCVERQGKALCKVVLGLCRGSARAELGKCSAVQRGAGRINKEGRQEVQQHEHRATQPK